MWNRSLKNHLEATNILRHVPLQISATVYQLLITEVGKRSGICKYLIMKTVIKSEFCFSVARHQYLLLSEKLFFTFFNTWVDTRMFPKYYEKGWQYHRTGLYGVKLQYD